MIMGDYYDDEDLYKDVKEMIDEGPKDSYVDKNFDPDLYSIQMSAKRTATHLRWKNGQSIHLGSMTEAEIVFIQNMPYDLAQEWH